MADPGTGQQRPVGWKKDPSGRHYGRWWDGSQWTEHVISPDEVQSVDPLTSWTEPPEGAPPAWFGSVPAAPSWTPGAQRRRGPAPMRPPNDDPRGKGTNQVLATVRAWPTWAKWTVGIVATLVNCPRSGNDQRAEGPARLRGRRRPDDASSVRNQLRLRKRLDPGREGEHVPGHSERLPLYVHSLHERRRVDSGEQRPRRSVVE